MRDNDSIGIRFTVESETMAKMTPEEFDEFWEAYGKAVRIAGVVRDRIRKEKEGKL